MTDHPDDDVRWHAGHLAKRYSVTRQTIAYKWSRGLLPPPQVDESGRKFLWRSQVLAHDEAIARASAGGAS